MQLMLAPGGILSYREALSYDLIDLVGNAGGSLGLLLGWSLLHLLDRACQGIVNNSTRFAKSGKGLQVL